MKKKILFIDHEVLIFDQSAGSRTSYMYLKLLLEMGLSVTFIAANFRKNREYAKHLRSIGAKVLTGKWFSRFWPLWFRLFARKFEFVFFNKPNPTKLFIPYVERFSNAKTLYQCHDLHYLRLLRQYSIDGNEKILANSQAMEQIESDLIQRVDVFLTFSHYEKEVIEDKIPGKKSEVIPLYFYDHLNPPITNFSKREGLLYIGGFPHTPNVDAVLWFAREVFPEIKKSFPDIIFYVAGSHPPAEIRDLEGDGIQVLGYLTDDELENLYSNVRLAIIPLRFGAGVKGKTMEAIHHCVPIVSTSIGIEGIGIEDIVPATDSPKDFSTRVRELYGDESALKEFSYKLHGYAKKNLTKDAIKEKMAQILDL
jgi:glycosyltransferase involved in cell wall biosynthesis